MSLFVHSPHQNGIESTPPGKHDLRDGACLFLTTSSRLYYQYWCLVKDAVFLLCRGQERNRRMAEIPKLPVGGRAATLRAWVKASKYGGCCRGSRINDNNKATHMDRVVLDSGGGWPACIGRASDK